ncbi:MAG: class I SAM-dependent methyltransferase [Anaerolineales bacterium]
MHRLRQLLRRRRPLVLSAQEAYDAWAPEYPPRPHNAFMQLEQDTLLAMLPDDLRGQTVLDLAAGSGRWGELAAQRGAALVLSLDASAAMLRAGTPPHPVEAEMTALPLRARSLDVIICGLAVGHLPKPRLWALLTEIRRALRPGGVALLSDVHPHRMWSGGQRRGQRGGHVFGIEHYIHSWADYHAACTRLNLHIADVREVPVLVGEPPALLALALRRID